MTDAGADRPESEDTEVDVPSGDALGAAGGDALEVAIVGAGFAGIGMGARLRRAGVTSFVMLERAAAVGGTWRENTYPGVTCDVPSHLYCFADHPNPEWSGVFARGSEIRDYLEHVTDVEGLRQHLRLESPLLAAEWDDAASLWRLQIGGADPRRITARNLVLACGRLTEPVIPDAPGLEGFPGPIFHSARWEHDFDPAGRHVAVVGTGASAVQIVPALVAAGARVTLFQRTPAWILPRGGRAYSDDERAAFAADPALLARLRDELYLGGEAQHPSRTGDPVAQQQAQGRALAHLHAQVADPALRDALTPRYAFGCRRVLLSDEFYPALASDAVTLETSPLAAVEHDTLVAGSGARHRPDAVVLATGFAASRQPYAELVTGAGGIRLSEHWGAGMTSFASTVVAGFPNMFVLDGPNASLGHNSAILMMEAQTDYVIRSLARRAERGGVLSARPEREEQYTRFIDDAAASTPWLTGGCRSWYVDDRSGRLTLLWPGTVEAFREMLAATDGSEFETRPATIGAQ